MYDNRLINKDSLEEYGDLVPGFYHDRIASGELFALATVMNGLEESPVGTSVLGVAGSQAQILWYALYPGYETAPYAADLIGEITSLVRSRGKAKGIFAMLPDRGTNPDVREAFYRNGYEVTSSVSGVSEFALGSVLKDKLPPVKEAGEFIPLKEADDKLLNQMGNLMASDERSVPVEMPVRWGEYDPDLSLIRVRNGSPEGLVLVRKRNEKVVFELAYEKSPKGLLTMISALVDRGEKLLTPDTKVIIPIVEERLFRALETIVPDSERAPLMKAYLSFENDIRPDLFADTEEAAEE